MNRLWGIPLVGLVLRWILLIPHWLIIGILGFLAGLSVLVSWIPVLFLGRMPDGLRNLGAYSLRYAGQVNAYLYLVTPRYPDSGPRPDPSSP